MPKKDPETEAYFRSLLPDDAAIVIKPMFGHIAAFVNGNMFAGTFGDQTFVRLPAELGAGLLKAEGSSYFSPMEGRPMKGYIVLPSGWKRTPDKARGWVSKALALAEKLPEKRKK